MAVKAAAKRPRASVGASKLHKRPKSNGAAKASIDADVVRVRDPEETRAYLIAQEIKFAKLFAGNDTKVSEKQLKSLRRWLKIRSESSFPFERANFMRIWKGLFYSMWMSDKPLPQEQLADNIATLVQAFAQPAIAVEFFGAFLQTMSVEWFGIDQWRIDKFMMLVRRVSRQMLVLVHGLQWADDLLVLLNAQIAQHVLKTGGSIGFLMHFSELWMEEVAKVSEGDLPVEAVTALIRPFATYLARPRDSKLCRHVVKHVFNYLLFQSELGREYQERFEAWKAMEFAGNSIDAIEKVDDEEEEEEEDVDDEENGADDDDDDDEDIDEIQGDEEDDESGEKHLDPRAGRVDVIMSEIPFDAEQILAVLEEEKTKPYTNVKSRQQLTRVINNYSTYATGKFPLGIQSIRLKSDVIDLPRIEDKVNELVQFESKLAKQNEIVKQLNKRQRKKLLAGKELSPTVAEKLLRLKKRKEDAEQEVLQRALSGKRAAVHQHNGNGCCGEPKKRRSLPMSPAERAKINQWDEEDLPARAKKVAKSPKAIVEEAAPVADETPVKTKKSPKPIVAPETPKSSASQPKTASPWDEPLKSGEVEITVSSKKRKLAAIAAAQAAQDAQQASVAAAVKAAIQASTQPLNRVLNPAALALLGRTPAKQQTASAPVTPVRSAERKRVKIMLQNNRSQETSEYVAQLISSPHTPYDANKQPPKSALKPNLLPTPINPYYKKKIGLSFD